MKPLHTAIAVLLLNHVPFTAMRMGLSLYALHLGAAPATVGMMVALYSVLPMLGSVHLGRLMDRRGMRKPLMAAVAVVMLTVLLAALSTSYVPLFAVTLLIGGSYNLVLNATQQLVGRFSTPQTRVANYSVLSVCLALSLAAVPMATGFLIDHAGFTATFLLMCAMPLPALVVLALDRLPGLEPAARKGAPESPAEKTGDSGGGPTTAAGGATTATGGATTATGSTTTATGSALDLLRNRELRQLYTFNVLFTVAWDLFLFMTPLYGAQMGLSASKIGIVVGALPVAMFLVRSLAATIAKHYSARQMLLISSTLCGLGALGFGLSGGMVLLVAFAFAMGLGQGLASPTLSALLYDTSPPGRVAEAMGLRTSLGKTCQVVLPVIGGSLSALLGFAPIYWIIAGMQLLAAWSGRAQWQRK